MPEEAIALSVTDLAKMADEYWSARSQRLELEKQIKPIKEREDGLQAAILDAMTKLQVTAIGGTLVQLTTKTTYEPTVEDWPSFYSYIKETGEFDLLYRRVNAAAVKQRWEEGLSITGVQKFPVTKLSKHEVK